MYLVNPLKHLVILACCAVALYSGAVQAEEEDLRNLELFDGVAGAPPSARAPRPASQIAENVTVITAAQIAELNAHTLAEVLQTVPGINLEQVRTPGSFAFFSLGGIVNTHVQVLIDGVPQDNLVQSEASPGRIPVQQIERVEIVKGAASAVWGEALGGVVNVVTKSPGDSTIRGAISASYGERDTRDFRAELSDTKGRFGYYLSGGNLSSRGLLPNNGVDHSNFYGKFTYDLPGKGSLTVGGSLDNAYQGLDENAIFHDTGRVSHHYAFTSLLYPIDPRLELEVRVRESGKRDAVRWGSFLPDGSVHLDNLFLLRESTLAAGTTLYWTPGRHKVVVGTEYEHDHVLQDDEVNPVSPATIDRHADRAAFYGNGAFSFGALTLLPGGRFDHTDWSGDVFSYTVGATYLVTENTVLRGYWAKGFSLPTAVFQHGLQKVWTLQAGVESSDIPALWLKGTLFYNRMSNIEGTNSSTFQILQKQIREGAELELRTVPLYRVSLSSGYTYTRAYDVDTGARVPEVPVHLAKMGLHYEQKELGLVGVLTGNYVVRYLAQGRNPNDRGTLWDVSLTKTFLSVKTTPEIFFTGHNIFNGAQYLSDLFRNAGRWFEGGVRFRF